MRPRVFESWPIRRHHQDGIRKSTAEAVID